MHTSVDLCRLTGLTDTDRKIWESFQTADPALISPYFSLGYYEIVDRIRGGVHVLRFKQDDRPVAFWPLRKSRWGTGRPVAGPMDDMHGIISAPDVTLDLQQPDVRRLIGGYTFSATPFSQRRHGLHGDYGDGNHVIDLKDGYEAWLAARSEASTTFRREHRRALKLIENPNVSIEHDIVDDAVFDRLIELKQAGYQGAGYFDLFSLDWPKPLLKALLQSNDPNAKGILSTLSLDGEVIASCLNMRSKTAIHYWFPGYEVKYRKQQPGLALLFSLLEWAAERGVVELNLGRGDMEFKRRMASWMQPVRGGAIAISGPQKFATDFTQWTASLEGSNPLLNLPSKVARKCHRAILAGSWRA